jgi:DNA-binding GntR family transcriptional regulator
MGVYLQGMSAPEAIWDEHAAILEAVATGKADKAERLARQHADESARKVREALFDEQQSQIDKQPRRHGA